MSNTLWLTGLSGAGKSTLAQALCARLSSMGQTHVHLDGDALRLSLNANLGFSEADRLEAVRRAAAVAALLNDAGLTVVVSMISPMRAMRALAREQIGLSRFLEVHVSTPLAVCEQRDPKGHYVKARQGVLPQFTGISAPYEAPEAPALTLDTSATSLEASLERLLALVPPGGQTSSA